MGCTFGRYRSTGKRWIPRLFYLVIWPMLPPDLPATTKFNRIIKEERAGHAKWRATSTMTDILGYDWMETLQIIRLVDLHGKHNINFSHATTPPRGRGSQRDGHGGNSHCGPFPPSLSLDVLCLRESSLWTNVTHTRNHWFRECLSNFASPWPLYSTRERGLSGFFVY